MSVTHASESITDAVLRWPGTHAETGSRGEWSLRLDRRELGHLHGDRVAHFGLPKDVWHELRDAGRITEHPVFPGQPGFGARAIETDEDLRDVVAILRERYDSVVARHGLPPEAATPAAR